MKRKDNFSVITTDFFDKYIKLINNCSIKPFFKSLSLIRFIFGYQKDGYIRDDIPIIDFLNNSHLNEQELLVLSERIKKIIQFADLDLNLFGNKFANYEYYFSESSQMFLFFEQLFYSLSNDITFSKHLIDNLDLILRIKKYDDNDCDKYRRYNIIDKNRCDYITIDGRNIYDIVIDMRKEIFNEINDLISKIDILVWNKKLKQKISFYLKYDKVKKLDKKLKQFVFMNLYEKDINKGYMIINKSNDIKDKKNINNNTINKSTTRENFIKDYCSEEERFVAQCFDFSFVRNFTKNNIEEVYKIGMRNFLKCYILKYFIIKKIKTIGTNSDIMNFFLYLVLSYNPSLFFINFDLFEKFSGIKIDYLEDIKFDQMNIDMSIMEFRNFFTSKKIFYVS